MFIDLMIISKNVIENMNFGHLNRERSLTWTFFGPTLFHIIVRSFTIGAVIIRAIACPVSHPGTEATRYTTGLPFSPGNPYAINWIEKKNNSLENAKKIKGKIK